MDWTAFCALFSCVSLVSSSKLHPRVTVDTGITRFSFENNISLMKLGDASSDKIIWVGGQSVLYSISPTQGSKPLQVNVPPFQNENKDSNSSPRSLRFSVLQEGADGNVLFICSSFDGNSECCNLTSSYSLTDCFTSENYEPDINEPSLLVGNMLYFTKRDKGLYRINNNKKYNIWPQTNEEEQTYLKLVAGKGQHKDKVYSFFTEKHKSEDESELWIPRVSQSCMDDNGGSKSLLQSSWTSMIYSRLFCGKGYEFTKMIDVATLETDNDIKVYALFRNYWNISAVCVYNMTEISSIFTSSEFNSRSVPDNHRPGTCGTDSTALSPEVLGFMKDRPEMKDWVMPENGPLLFTHRHYTHIQVDRVRGHTVLLLSLESGGVHKVLENPLFVIAEYLPFQHETHITSMLLDASERRLYVSSSHEVVQIDLQTCQAYGDQCNECRLSRDPYCGWDGLRCTSRAKFPALDILNCNKPEAAPSKTEVESESTVIHVSPSSKHFLLCPKTSHHAEYRWYRGETLEECVHSKQSCLYLIHSMNETHEGHYRCESTEEGYTQTLRQYTLSMSRSDGLRLAPLLLMLTACHGLLASF
ncbi:semaphorin-7A [Puntigrus tetrazona]|uniref:semaphorin-7A n=1 Tax=Puntigrus tetrazona TaxID=1606681 RepID=UPI001C89CDC3|nr:semaphorin-7A [Puntigrus tetrazona]